MTKLDMLLKQEEEYNEQIALLTACRDQVSHEIDMLDPANKEEDHTSRDVLIGLGILVACYVLAEIIKACL